MKITKVIIFLVGIIGTGFAFLIDVLYRQSLLSRGVYKTIAEPLFDFSVAIIIISIFLIFVRQEVFRAWLRFAYVWMPLSLVVIYLSAGWTGGGFGIPNVLDQETVAIIFSGLFVIISLLLVIWKHFTFRRSSQV